MIILKAGIDHQPNPIRNYIASRDNEPFEAAASLLDRFLRPAVQAKAYS